MKTRDTGERQSCGRRYAADGSKPDTWQIRGDNLFRSCSYCGSMHPDDLFRFLGEGAELGPTDKNYKVYVHRIPSKNLEALTVVGYSSSRIEPLKSWDEMTSAERAAIRKYTAGWTRDMRKNVKTSFWQLKPVGPTVDSKFYFQHFDTEQQKKFIDLVNAHAVLIGIPGHFYVTPFFAARKH